ncbi:MAG: 4-(cytidine 5'-diphospho)-2-C-methyl-D-erythritol kinase [Chitinophagaceae bacterium]
MIAFPNCKINLGLTVYSKRSDGFHDLETIFYPIAVTDILEITSCHYHELITQEEKNDFVVFTASGTPIAGSTSDNLCIRAYRLLKKDFPELPPVRLHLHKVIPMGAGLGGGSADGAFTLLTLNEKYQLNLTKSQLISYAVVIGSDCPFFIINSPCLATSRGESMETVMVNLSDYTIILVNADIHINTGWAFHQLHRSADYRQEQSFRSITDVIVHPVESWKNELVNDFEQPVFSTYPALQKIKDALYSQGAIYAAMSGSGSTMFGIFRKDEKPILDFPPGYDVMTVK